MTSSSAGLYTVKVGKSAGNNAWLVQLFTAKAATTGGVLRRKKTDVIRYASLAALKAEVARRQFHLVEIGDQYVVLCNKGEIKLHV